MNVSTLNDSDDFGPNTWSSVRTKSYALVFLTLPNTSFRVTDLSHFFSSIWRVWNFHIEMQADDTKYTQFHLHMNPPWVKRFARS